MRHGRIRKEDDVKRPVKNWLVRAGKSFVWYTLPDEYKFSAICGIAIAVFGLCVVGFAMFSEWLIIFRLLGWITGTVIAGFGGHLYRETWIYPGGRKPWFMRASMSK